MENAKVLSISFNQGRTTFMVGTDVGFIMYRVNPLEKLSERVLGGGIGIATQLYESNFIGLVGGGDNPAYPVNQFVLWNDYTQPSTAGQGQRGEAIVTQVEKDKIVAVRLNQDVIAVVMRKCAKLYHLSDMTERYKVKTSSNPDGVCDLSSTTGSVFLCPGMEVGTVNIVDYKAKTERLVRCCSHSLRSITLNTAPDLSEESKLQIRSQPANTTTPDTIFATTSTEGTLIRVHDIATQTLVKELRRGSDACEIYGVHFSPDSRCLAVTSSKNTTHIFSLDKDFGNQPSRASFLGPAIGYFGSEWSSFTIDFSPTTNITTPQPGGPQFQSQSGPVRHIGCIFPTATPGSSPDSFRLLIISCGGTYAVHDLQFKDHKSIPRNSGLFLSLPPPQTLLHPPAAPVPPDPLGARPVPQPSK